MAVKFSNNARTNLSSAILSTATSITVDDASVFPTLGASDHTFVTFESLDVSPTREIVKVTAIDTSTDTLTVVRGQDGTTAAAFSSGAKVELRLTAALLNAVADDADTESVSISGDTMTGNLSLGDSNKVIFGAGSDLQVYHDGFNNYIDTSTGSLLIRNTNDNYHVIIQSDNGGGGLADYFRAKGDTGEALLYHYGSEKLATTSTGIDVTGTAVTDGLTANGAAEGDTYFTGGTANSRLLNIFTSTHGGGANAGHNFKVASGTGAFIFGNDTTANLLTVQTGGINVTGTITSTSDISADTQFIVNGSGNLLKVDVSSWGSNSDQVVLWNGWNNTIHDHVVLKAAGNSTAHGAIVVADTVFSYGSTTSSVSTSASQTNPLSNSTAFTVTSGGNANFAGDVTVSGGQIFIGKADTSSAHLNSYELMTFNIDTDNDDTNRYFKWTTDANSGSGTQLMLLDDSGNATFAGSVETGGDIDLNGYGLTSDDHAKFYVWRAIDNTANSTSNYKKIARVTASQSTRFMITLTGRSNSYGDGVKGSKTEIYGQLNNDNNYDITYTNYDFSATDPAVSEVGYIDIDTTSVDVYVKVAAYSELAAYGVVSDGSMTPDSTSSSTTTEPTNYTAATSNTIWTDASFTSTDISNYDSAYNYSQVGHLPLAGGTLTGSLTGLTVDYTGNRTGDAGILVTNDASDWGIKVDKDGTADYGILSQTDGENALVVRNAAGINKVQIQGDGDASFSGDVTLGTSSDATRYLVIDKATTGVNGILLKNAGNNKVKLLQNADEHFELHTNNTLALTVDESQAATFAGTITTQGAGDIIIEDTGGGSAHLRLKSSSGGTVSSHWKLKTNSANHFYIDNDTQGTSPVTINSNGNVDLSGRLQIATSSPVFIINDSDATNATNQVGYVSWQRQGSEKSWMGYGSTGNDRFAIQNTEGELTIYPNVVVSNGSPEIMFETGATHYNWRIAAQQSLNAAFEIGYGSADNDATNDSFTTVFTTTQGGTTTLSNNQDISMNANGAGQLVIKGNGYNGAIALDGTGMHIYHNSASRDLILGVNETEALRIHGSTRQVQLNNHATEALKIKSNGGAGYTQGSILIESSTISSPQGRGQGVYMFNEGQDRTWYAGTLYTAGGTYGIGHASGTTFQASAASASNAVMSINTSNQTTFGGTVFINGTSDNQLFLNSNSTSANTGLFFRENGSDKWELYHRGSDKNLTIYSYVAQQITAAFHDDGRLELQGPAAAYSALRMGSSANTSYTHMMFTSNSGTGEIWKSGTGYTDYGGASALNIYNSNANIAFFPHGATTAQLNLADGASTFSGRVGIGDSNPPSSVKLAIQHDGMAVRLDGTANTSRTLMFRNVGTAEGIIQTDGNMHLLQEDANKYIRFSTADTERLRITADGELRAGPYGGNGNAVIAGTSSPSFTNQPGTNLLLKSGDGSGTGSSYMTFSTSPPGSSGTTVNTAQERMRIGPTGNIGLSSTNLTHDLGTLLNANNATIIGNGTSGSYFGYNVAYQNGAWKYQESSAVGLLSFTNSGVLTFRNAASGTAGNTASLTERFLIDSDKAIFEPPIQADDGIRAWTDSGTKFYTHLATGSYYGSTGYIIVNTQIPGHNQSGNANMFSFRVQGFWYDANAGGIIDFVVGCYAGENNFYNCSYVGSIPDAWSGAVAFYTDNNGKVALVLGSGTTAQKCEISVTDFTQGYVNVNTSYAQNWSTQITTSLSGYTNGQTVSPRNRLEKLRGNTTIESGHLTINDSSITIGDDTTYGTSGTGKYVTIGFGGRSNGSNRVFAHTTSQDGLYIASGSGQGVKIRTNGSGSDTFHFTSNGYLQLAGSNFVSPTRDVFGTKVAASDNLKLGDNHAVYRVGHMAVAGSSTGAILIQLPGARSQNWSMATLRISVYEYDSNAHNIYHVSGHDWTSGWYNTGVTHDGFSTAEDVAFADNTTTNKQGIVIGSTSEGREYLVVTVDVISSPHFYRNNMSWTSGVTVSLETSLSGWSVGSSRIRSSLRTSIGNKHRYDMGNDGRLYGGSTAYIRMNSGSYATIQGDYGYVQMGAGNTSYSHFYTDRSRYYFNRHIVVDEGIVASYDEDLILRRAQSSTYQVTLGTDGLTASHNVTAYSDERLKEDIKVIPSADALDTVKKLEGVTYRRIDNQEESIGFIAQQIERDCPEIADRVVGEMDDERKTKHVNYANMVALLSSAIQEQQKTIDALTKRIEELENGSNKKHDD